MKLSASVLSLMDPDGSAIVIHAAEDDGMTDATGNPAPASPAVSS
jgi:Cu/Zn superoxide dismutase